MINSTELSLLILWVKQTNKTQFPLEQRRKDWRIHVEIRAQNILGIIQVFSND
jgi:hypothetical protein